MTSTVVTVLIMIAVYALGKGVGRREGREQARREAVPPLHLMLELDGEVIGGLSITGVRPGDGWSQAEAGDDH
ncbi:hypothetical protein SEA_SERENDIPITOUS_61 [Mycobacterium phage Serendipitous]|uniref:Uncharacterized protein n=1 Tax=Mycobacterium phage Serendipitous TaxID=2301619 RepID=A0A385UFS1_9CAUD|nr:hypothetical protein I5G64_gp61 [Mycobacterium phage Serendipitous]AYB70602.1 hypothetical protein SEA_SERENDIPITOUS_61 [Mycobacterium phage Serendipitous]